MITALLFLGFLVSIHAATDQSRTVTVTGSAEMYVVPDEATITIGVETFHQQLQKAKSENDAKSQLLLAALKEVGIPEDRIGVDTIDFQLSYKQLDYQEAGIPSIQGYFAKRTYTIRFCQKTLPLLEKAIDTSLENGANRINDITLSSSQVRVHRDEARRMAIRAAKEKAQLFCEELDVKVGRPIQIHEGYAPQFSIQNKVAYGGSAGGADIGRTPLGQIPITAQVEVVFEIDSSSHFEHKDDILS
eukprot:TRINITY_DN10149_c0_g1_i1.p1 TRINITY_DN10149_c0_g1~~TRINITY_DN10149_c0_g1_i1.p1  ORF type:complete len:246 (-),score=65.73 TRINITY_DN10149_c0_g1_i1:139-876(-)